MTEITRGDLTDEGFQAAIEALPPMSLVVVEDDGTANDAAVVITNNPSARLIKVLNILSGNHDTLPYHCLLRERDKFYLPNTPEWISLVCHLMLKRLVSAA